MASGRSPIASHGLEVALTPGEEEEIIFVLGYIEDLRLARMVKQV